MTRNDYTLKLIDEIQRKYSIASVDEYSGSIALSVNEDLELYATPDWEDVNESITVERDYVTVATLDFVYTFDLQKDTDNYIRIMNEYISSLKVTA